MRFFRKRKMTAVKTTGGKEADKQKGARGLVRKVFRWNQHLKRSRHVNNGSDEREASKIRLHDHTYSREERKHLHRAALINLGKKHVAGQPWRLEPRLDPPAKPVVEPIPEDEEVHTVPSTGLWAALDILLQYGDFFCSSVSLLRRPKFHEAGSCGGALTDDLTATFSIYEVPREINVESSRSTSFSHSDLKEPYQVLERMEEQKMRSFLSQRSDILLPRLKVYVDRSHTSVEQIDERSACSDLTSPTVVYEQSASTLDASLV